MGLSELIALALEAQDEGRGEVNLELLCADYPEWIDRVAAALAASSRLPSAEAVVGASDPRAGSIVAGRYQLDQRIGAGAMGVVYRATDLDLGRQVAVKMLNFGLIDAAQATARFDREAEVLAAVEHDAVVRVYDRGIGVETERFLVMEHLVGPSLGSILHAAAEDQPGSDFGAWLKTSFGVDVGKERTRVRIVARWAHQLARGLVAVHGAGILHRDIKPSNVIVRLDGRAVLIDFGIAANSNDVTLTRADAAVGTPAYMAPEVLEHGLRTSPSVDTYGLAATLYHLLTEHAPYEGSPSQVLTALATREPKPAATLSPGLPRDILAILDTGLARNANRRYPSVAALGSDLAAFLEHRPVVARRISTLTRVWYSVKRSRVVHGAAMVAVLALAALLFRVGRQHLAQESKAAFLRAWPHVPANLGIVGQANRKITHPDALDRTVAALDAVVEAGWEPVPAHLVRAAFRLDQGSPALAAADVQVAARTTGSALIAELADRYGSVPAGTENALAISLEDLPEPATPTDHYVLAFHELRCGHLDRALPRILGPGKDANRHSRELALLAQMIPINALVRREEWGKVHAAALVLTRDVVAFENQTGMRSANTAHYAAWGQARMERYSEALETALAGIALSDATHVTLQNAARVARRLGATELARRLATQALDLVPGYLHVREELILIECDARQVVEARRLLAEAPAAATRRDKLKRAELAATIEATVGLDALLIGDDRVVREASSAALAALDGSSSKVTKIVELRALAEALSKLDRGAVFRSLVRTQTIDPLDPIRLSSIRKLMPEQLSVHETNLLSALWEAQALSLSRGRQALTEDG